MAEKEQKQVDPKLRELLNEIRKDVGSFRKMSDASGVNPDAYSGVYRDGTPFDGETAVKFSQAYGGTYGFTTRQVFDWAGIPRPPDEEDARMDQRMLRIFRGPIGVQLLVAEGSLTDEHFQFIERLISRQLKMLREGLLAGELLPDDTENTGGEGDV